jgi:hypothetical protein
MPEADVLILPYDSADGRSLIHILIRELGNADWTHFAAAVAFVNSSGNCQELLRAIDAFAGRGGIVDLTFGADSPGGEQASEYQAILDLLTLLDGKQNAHVYLYHEPGRTFHPKIYLFYNAAQALMIVGSSNWSYGGQFNNVETSALLKLELSSGPDAAILAKVLRHFTEYWRPTCPQQGTALLRKSP